MQIRSLTVTWEEGIRVSFNLTQESSRLNTVSIGMAVDDYDYALYTDRTGLARSHNFDLRSIHKRPNPNSTIHVIIGLEDIDGHVGYSRFRRSLAEEGGKPYITNMRGFQRLDGSGLIDFFYDFNDEPEVAYGTVELQISDDFGENFSVSGESATGDIGSGIRTGQNRHIVWDPNADLPGSTYGTYWATISLVSHNGKTAVGDALSGMFVVDLRDSKTPYVTFVRDDEKPRYGEADTDNPKNFGLEVDILESSSSSSSSSISSSKTTTTDLSESSSSESSSSSSTLWMVETTSSQTGNTSSSSPIDLTPTMTDWNSPSPYEVTESNFAFDRRGWRAFDGEYSGDANPSWWFRLGSNPDPSGEWVKIYYGGEKVYITGYEMTVHSIETAPVSWSLQGSLNNITWHNVDSRLGQTFTGDPLSASYSAADPGAYRWYRLLVTECGGYPDNLTLINGIKFFE